MTNDEGFDEIGTVGIDTGRLLLGDPCYLREQPDPGVLRGEPRQLDDGCCMAVPTGYGDGCYPVLARRRADGRIAEIRVIFFDDSEAA